MYEQIVDQIRSAIYSGDLATDESLPSLRQLARDLGVSLITTTRAYNELAAAGLIANQQGRGSFVLPIDENAARQRLEKQMADGLTAAHESAVRLGLTREQFLERCERTWSQRH